MCEVCVECVRHISSSFHSLPNAQLLGSSADGVDAVKDRACMSPPKWVAEADRAALRTSWWFIMMDSAE